MDHKNYLTMTRRTALGVVPALFTIHVPLLAQATAIILVCRDSNRGSNTKEYRLGDVVEVFDDDGNFGLSANPALYPPFWYVRIQGPTKAQALQYMQPEFDVDGVMVWKRPWGIQPSSVPVAIRNFLTTNKFIGFGSTGYKALFGATIPAVMSDTTYQWSTVRAWILNKTTGLTAPA